MQKLASGMEMVGSRRATLLEIKNDFHDWAWMLLNTKTSQQRLKLVNEGIVGKSTSTEVASHISVSSSTNTQDTKYCRVSGRSKRANIKYSTTIYDLNYL